MTKDKSVKVTLNVKIDTKSYLLKFFDNAKDIVSAEESPALDNLEEYLQKAVNATDMIDFTTIKTKGNE